MVSAEGGEPRLLAKVRADRFSRREAGGLHTKGQVWTLRLGDPGEARTTGADARRGAGSALVSRQRPSRLRERSRRSQLHRGLLDRHASRSPTSIRPPIRRLEPVWSPDSNRIAYLRIPFDKNAMLFVPHRTALPWSIRVSDLTAARAARSGAPRRHGQRLPGNRLAPISCTGPRETASCFRGSGTGGCISTALPAAGGDAAAPHPRRALKSNT